MNGFTSHKLNNIIPVEKSNNFSISDGDDQELGHSMNSQFETKHHLDFTQKEWYAYSDCFGASEEKALVLFIDSIIPKLIKKYDDLYLVRNERFFKIYNFDDGRAIEPDFELFLSKIKIQENVNYQIFIESKGDHLLACDDWKENFLISVDEEYHLQRLWGNEKFVIWGKPFFNRNFRLREFDNKFILLFWVRLLFFCGLLVTNI